jgi:hypothetical protein
MPSERLTAADALQHPFVQLNSAKPEFVPMKLSLVDNMRNFGKFNALKKAALQVIATYVEVREIKKHRDVR